jgi:Flp pilus assembly protein CpaB
MNRRLLVVAAVAMAAFLAAYILSRSGESGGTVATIAAVQPKLDLEQVLVAGQDLPMGGTVEETQAVWQDWPRAAVSELMITKKEPADQLKALWGSYSRRASRSNVEAAPFVIYQG